MLFSSFNTLARFMGCSLMCGIAGIYAYHPSVANVNMDELHKIRDYMALRGPDGKGEWVSENKRIGLAHRRLAIIETSDLGAQPMLSQSRNTVISFNGEIYNFKALRTELELKGCHFTTESDTEVLLNLYEQEKEGMLHKLRGMFAFAIWDEQRQSIFMARDPYGIKPLYYIDDGRTFRFASQVKALLAGGEISTTPSAAGIVGFHLFGSVPEPFTVHQEINQIPAGNFMWINSQGVTSPKPYFSIARVYLDAKNSGIEKNQQETEVFIRDALLDSVQHHLVSDVPVGAFLSAGIDSGSLVGLMRDAGQEHIKTITLGFSDFKNKQDDETILAEQLSQQYQTEHTTRWVTLKEFQEDLPNILSMMDQPSIDGINTWFVSKAAKEQGLKVVVSGLGGDELFGGYPSFKDLPSWVKHMRYPSRIPCLGKWFRSVADKMLKNTMVSQKLAGILEYGGSYEGAYLLKRGIFMPWELDDLLDPGMIQSGFEQLNLFGHSTNNSEVEALSAFARVSTLESSLYMKNQLLRDSDWASMAHSVEVRVPLVDSWLLKQVADCRLISEHKNKYFLAKSPANPIPQMLQDRAKTGFSTPIKNWIKEVVSKDDTTSHYENSEKAHWARPYARWVVGQSITA